MTRPKRGAFLVSAKHTERPMAVTEHTESVGDVGRDFEVLCLLCAAKRLQCVPW